MGSLLGVLLIYLLINVFLLGIGSGIGFLLHKILPAVDLGIGILIGVVVASISIHFFSRILVLLDEAGEDDEDLEQVSHPRLNVYSLRPLPLRRSKKRKPSR